MKLFSVILTIVCILYVDHHVTWVDTSADDSSDEGDYSHQYMDAVVSTMELLHSINGTLQSVLTEFDKIHGKLGINISQVKELLMESRNVLEIEVQKVQNKFSAVQVALDRMVNPLNASLVDTIMSNLEELKKRAEEMENQYIRTMVEAIKDHADQGISDLLKFQENINDIMEKVGAVAATAKSTMRKMGNIYNRPTKPSIF